MRQSERLSRILERLAQSGSVGVTALAAELGVSTATIRRDLEALEEQRLLRRTHGGAVGEGILYELPVRYRGARRQEEKLRIAAEAATRIPDGSVIGLTGGTTTTEVARALSDRSGLTVVTNSLTVAGELAVRPDARLLVTGGVLRGESYELVGPLAEQSLAELNLDTAIVGVDGIGARVGLTTHHEVEAHTNRAMIERAQRVIVVADGSKIGATAFARIVAAEAVHELITDASADADEVEALRALGITVSIA